MLPTSSTLASSTQQVAAGGGAQVIIDVAAPSSSSSSSPSASPESPAVFDGAPPTAVGASESLTNAPTTDFIQPIASTNDEASSSSSQSTVLFVVIACMLAVVMVATAMKVRRERSERDTPDKRNSVVVSEVQLNSNYAYEQTEYLTPVAGVLYHRPSDIPSREQQGLYEPLENNEGDENTSGYGLVGSAILDNLYDMAGMVGDNQSTYDLADGGAAAVNDEATYEMADGSDGPAVYDMADGSDGPATYDFGDANAAADQPFYDPATMGLGNEEGVYEMAST